MPPESGRTAPPAAGGSREPWRLPDLVCVAHHVVAADGGVTAVRAHQRGENAYRGRFSRVVRAQQAEQGPGADGEVDPVERDRVPVPLDQPFGMYGVSHAAPPQHPTKIPLTPLTSR